MGDSSVRVTRSGSARRAAGRRRPRSPASRSPCLCLVTSDSDEGITGLDDAPTAASGKTARKKQKKGPAVVHTFPDATLGVCIERGLARPQLVRRSLLRDVCAGKITEDDPLGPIPEFQDLFDQLHACSWPMHG
eukprot:COSAG01_NODE_129_length_24935_cov_39.324368_25_plen_134_part_00